MPYGHILATHVLTVLAAKDWMLRGVTPYLRRYGIAVLTVALALLLTTLSEVLFKLSIIAFFYLAVLVTSFYSGKGPGLASAALSVLSIWYFFISPKQTFAIVDHRELDRLIAIALVIFLISIASSALRAARKAEVDLRRSRFSEERLRWALDGSPITLFEQDQDLRYRWVYNPEGFAIAPIIGKTDADLFLPKEAQRLTALKQQVLGSGTSTQEEVELTLDGKAYYYDLLIKPLYNAAGNCIGVTCTAIDITARRRAEEALRQSDNRFRRLAESNIFGVAFVEPDGTFTYANEAFLQMVGYTREEIASGSLHWHEVTPPEYFQLDAEAGKELNTKGMFTPFEKEYIRKDGRRVPILIGGAVLEEPYNQAQQAVCFYLDLTELRRTEKELRRIKERFELAALAVKGVVYEWNAATNQTERTQELVNLLGYTPEEAEPSTEWWDQWIHPEDVDRLHQTAQNALESGADSFTVEYRVLHRDGQYRYVWDRAKIERDADGRAIRTVGFNLDITDRKQVEEALRESEERFRTMADTMPGLVWMADENQLCTYFNRGWLDFSGRTLEQELGNGWTENVHPGDLERCLKIYTTAFDDRQEFSMEYRLRRFDGEYRWILDRAVPRFTPDGSFVGYIGTCIDISDRKRSEEAQQYLAEASSVLASSLDYQTTLTSVAQLTVPHMADWCTVYVLEEDGSVQRLATVHANAEKVAWANELIKQYPLDPDEPRGAAQVLRTGKPELYSTISDELLIQSAYDSEHLKILRELGLQSVMMVPLLAHGRILGVMTFAAAESGRHYTQADLELAEELARRAALAVDNARLYHTAQRDRAKAEAANRSKDEFLATLSHELRTPLNAMLGWMQILNSRQLDEATNKRALETVHRNTKALKTIIEDLLDVSRITSGKLHLQVHPVELVPIIEAAIEAVRPAAIAKSINLKFFVDDSDTANGDSFASLNEADGEFTLQESKNGGAAHSQNEPFRLNVVQEPSFLVMGDPDRLQQVFWNLLSNSVKFTPKFGRVEIRLSLVTDYPADSAEQSNENEAFQANENSLKLSDPTFQSSTAYAQVQIRDTGMGIAPSFLPYVFDRFRQADMTTTKAHGGLGLGLAIVRHLVEMHGGTVSAESEGLDKGASFAVTLPMLNSAMTLEPTDKSDERFTALANESQQT